MDLSRIYTKTSRGILDGALKTRALGREHGRLFALIDGQASLEDLLAKNSRLSQNHLAAIIDQLVSAGLIRLINEIADVDDLGFSSTIIVSEANTQAFFDAQIAADIKTRLAEVEESLAQDKAREALLQEVTADIAAEAKALKRQETGQPTHLAQHDKASSDKSSSARQTDPTPSDTSKSQSRAELEAHAKALLAESGARAAKQKKSAQEQHDAQIKAREELDRAAREEAKKSAQTASLVVKAVARESKQEKERVSKALAEQERRKLEAKIISEEEAQRNAELDAHFLAIEGTLPALKEAPVVPNTTNQSHLAAELDARVKRRLEARAREEVAATAKAQAEEAARLKVAEAVKRQVEAEAAAAQLEAERKARLEAEQKAQAEAQARAQAAAIAKAQAEEAARLKAAEAAKRQVETEAAAAQLEAEHKARLEAEQNAQAEAQARAQAAAIAKAQTEEAARLKAAEAVKRQVGAEAAAAQLEAARKARLEAEQKAQAEAQARAQAAAIAKAQAEEAARLKAAEAAKRQTEAEAAAAQLEAERKARLEAEQKAQAEAEACAQAAATAKAQAEEAARLKAAEAAKRQVEAEAAAAQLEAERKARLEAEQKAQAEAEARAQAAAAAKAQAEEAARIKAAEDEVKLQAKLEAEAIALVAEAEEAVRQEAAAVKRQMEERQQQEEEARLVHAAAAEQEIEAELQAQAQAEKTAQTLSDERVQMESAVLAREQEQVRAREAANAKARAEMEEALRREQDALAQEKNEEDCLREEAQARALAAAKLANLPLFAQKKRKPLRYNPSWNKSIARAVLGVLLLGVALAHLLPFNFYIPKLERQLSDSLGQRVTVETLRFSAYPAPHLELEGVVIGDKVGARLEKASIFPAITAWFSDVKLMRRVELDSITLSADSLDAFPLWSRQQARAVPFQFERLLVKNGKFKHPLLDGFTFDAEMDVRRGKFVQAKVMSSDQRVTLNFVPQTDALRIDLQAKQLVWPLEPRLTLDSLKLTALSQAGALTISDIEAQLFEGYATGTAQVSWSKGWTYNAELKLLQIAMAPSLARFTREAKVTGTLEAKMRLAGQADALDTLFETSQVQATYRVKNGDYSGIDLVRAIQAPRRGGHIGGKTNFDDLTGFFQYSKGQAQFRQIKLQGGVVSASGNLSISQDKALSGNLLAEFHTPSAKLRSSFVFAGTLETPVLNPFAPRAVSVTEKSESANEAPAATNVTQPAN